MEQLPFLSHLKSEISDLKSFARSISRQLAGWAFSLQETDITGARHRTEKSKENYHREKRATAFFDGLKREHEERLKQLKKEREEKQ